jgi:hypothetical protein
MSLAPANGPLVRLRASQVEKVSQALAESQITAHKRKRG